MRGPVENFQKRLPLGIPKRDSCGRNLPVFPALKLNVETLISTPDQSPPNDVDVLDDDYWFHEIFRAPKLSGNLRPTHLPSTSGGPMPNRKNGGRNGWNVSGDSGNWCSRRTKPAIPESGKKWMRWCSVRRRREPHQRRYKPPPLPGSASVPCARVLAKSEEPPPRTRGRERTTSGAATQRPRHLPQRHLPRPPPFQPAPPSREQPERPCLFASRALRLRVPSPSASVPSAADAPGPPKHLGSLRGVRRYRRTASRLRSGAPTACGRQGPGPGGGREIGQLVWLALGRFRRPGRHSWPGWFPRSTFLALRSLRPPTYLGICPRPKESLGSTKTGHLLGRSHFPDRGWGFLGILADREWGFIAAWFAAGMWIYLPPVAA